MTDFTRYHNPDFVDYCQQALQKYTSTYRGIDLILLSTPSGFEIASYTKHDLYDQDKIAAMSSSLFKVGDSISEETHLHDCESLLLDGRTGKLYISSISHPEYPVVLVVKVNERATLGNMTHGADKLNRQIIDKLAADN